LSFIDNTRPLIRDDEVFIKFRLYLNLEVKKRGYMNRPKIILYVGASVDGRISMNSNATMFDTFKQPELYDMFFAKGEWELFQKQITDLYKPDMFLEGCNMLVAENSKLTELPAFDGEEEALYHDYLPDEILNRLERTSWTSVVDGRGRFRNGYTGDCDDPHTYMIHLTTQTAPPEYLAFLQSHKIPYLIEGENQVNLPKMFEKVKSILKVNTIATSSGGRLSGALIRNSLLDEVNILLSPIVIGGSKVPFLFNSPEPKWPDIIPNKLELIETKTLINDKIWFRYKVIS